MIRYLAESMPELIDMEIMPDTVDNQAGTTEVSRLNLDAAPTTEVVGVD